MKSILVTMLAFGTLAAAAPAFAANDTYCLQGRQWGYPGNCQFATYQQCVATASGTGAACGRNPMSYYPHGNR